MGDITLFEKTKDLAKARKLGPEIVQAIENLKEFYDRCRQNRNQLSHFGLSWMGIKDIERPLSLTRRKGPIRHYPKIDDSLETIRRVADDLFDLRVIIVHTLMFVRGQLSSSPKKQP